MIFFKKLHMRSTILVITLYFISHSVFSIENRIFDHLGENHGLASGLIYDILEDKNGFIWIGTENGLQRFDGSDFVTFQNNSNSLNSISDNYVRIVHEDTKNRIWAGTENGLNLYDPLKNKFERFDFQLEGENRLKANSIRAIYQDQPDTIWVGNYVGLTKIDTQKNTVKNHFHKPVRSIITLDSNNLLIGTLGYGLYIFNKKTTTFSSIEIDTLPSTIKSSDLIITDLARLQDYIYIATWGGGLYKLNTLTKKIKTFKIDLTSKYIYKINVKNSDEIWIGTNSGLTIYNFITNKSLLYNELVAHNYNSNIPLTRSILFTNNDTTYLGTHGDGIFRITIPRLNVEYFGLANAPNKGLRDPVVYSFSEQTNGDLIIGTESGELALFNPISKEFEHYNLYKNKQPLGVSVKNISTLSNGKILVQYGYQIYLVDSRKLTQNLDDNLNQFNLNNYQQLVKSKMTHHNRALLWGKNSLDVVEIKDGLFQIVNSFEIKDLPLEYLISKTNDLYLSFTSGQLTKIESYDKPDFKIKQLRGADNLGVNSFTIDNFGNIWLATSNLGIAKFNEDKEMSFLTKEEGLIGNSPLSITFDEKSNSLWISAYGGISKINLDTKKIENFTVSDGLQGRNFLDVSHKAKDGTIYFAGERGFNRINPSGEIKSPKPIDVKITEMYLRNEKVTTDKNLKLLNKPIYETNDIFLGHRQNSFSFRFSALIHSEPSYVKYQYSLQNYDDDYVTVDHTKRFVNYSNLDSGFYIFKIKAIDQNGEPISKERKVNITIATAPWATPLAKFLYIALATLAISFIIQYRTRALSAQAKKLKIAVEEQTRELATEKNKVEQLLSKKNDEFTNVSHEFRTPLTLIIGPLNNFIKKYQTKVDTSELTVIERNSQRLLRMVNQMLNMETLKVDAITKRIPENFKRITELGIKAFTPISKDKGIDISLEQKVDICFSFTPDAYEKILLNLLSNAVKYTNEGGSIKVTTTRTDNEEFVLTVKDTGIGIAEDKQTNIFERFNRVIDENSERVTGAGIGLALVKDLVEAHDGRIELESELGQGTTIRVYLPIINEVAASSAEQHENKELVAMELMALADNQLEEGKREHVTLEHQENRPSVLVIEDNADMRHYIESNINSHYQVLIAKNGEEGVKLAESEVPDLIISDIMMPKMNGYEVTRALRQSKTTSHIPIILLTAKSDLESRIKGWQENADEYLTKPFNIDELLVRLKNLLDIRDLLKKRFANIAFALTDKTTVEKQPVNQEEDQEAFIIQLNSVLNEIYADSNTRVKDIATNIAMSDRQLHRKLKGLVDLSPNEYLRRYRLEKGKELLAQGKSPNYVAFEVGFSSQSYFGRCFKAQYGVAPSDYAK